MSFPGERPLQLKSEMEHSWLVQRLGPPSNPNPFSFGGGLQNGGLSDAGMFILKHIFSFDYMGSSEFEWGAVPVALSFLAKQGYAGNLTSGTLVIPDKGNIYYLCPKEYTEEVERRILMWAGNSRYMHDPKCDTKERVGLREALNKDKYSRTLGWLELDNGYMFFIDEIMFNRTKELLTGVQTT